MMYRRSFLQLAASSCMVAATPSAFADDETSRVLLAVAASRSKLKTLVADFRQTRRIGLLATDIVSRGRMMLVLPERLRWELLPPDAMTYWVGPEGLTYASGTARATADRKMAGPLGDVMDDLLTVLGGDIGALRTRYHMSAKQIGRATRIEARPRSAEMKKFVSRLELELGADRVSPASVLVQESDLEYAKIAFSNVRTNVAVDAALMQPNR